MLGLGNSITSGTVYDDVSWVPTDVDGLVLWHKNGTNIAVGQWNDSSGNNNHITQGTSGEQATVTGGGLDFEETESDHYDLESTITIAVNQGFCFAAVVTTDLAPLRRMSGVALAFPAVLFLGN